MKISANCIENAYVAHFATHCVARKLRFHGKLISHSLGISLDSRSFKEIPAILRTHACIITFTLLLLGALLAASGSTTAALDVVMIEDVTFSDENPIHGDEIEISAKLANYWDRQSEVTVIFFEFIDVNISEFMNLTQEKLVENTIGMEVVQMNASSFGWANVTWDSSFGSHYITIMMLGEEQLPVQASIFVEDVNESPAPAALGIAFILLVMLLAAVLPAIIERVRK
jgi:hypothetical protein